MVEPTLGENYVGGIWSASGTGQTFEQRNPARLDQVTGQWPRSSPLEARRAIDAAAAAYSSWSSTSVFDRATVLRNALRLLTERSALLERIIVAENGKTLAEARAEVTSALREMEHQIEEGVRPPGELSPSAMEGVTVLTRRVPLGVVVLISPWNFPLNVPARKLTPALMAGNACVLKPSSLTPGAASELVRCLEAAGLPPGVLNLVHGGGSDIGDALLDDPRVSAVSFTGSTPVGVAIHARASAKLIRTQMEMGGKNPLVVLADADIDGAADAAVTAGFSCAGQWCTATSRVIVERRAAEPFIEALQARLDEVVVGAGDDPAVTMGPVCGTEQLDGVMRWIERGVAEGARVVRGGDRLWDGGLSEGCFIAATVFTDVTPDMAIAQEEVFGPVLSVLVADGFEQAVEMANGVRFGLASSIFTRDLEKAMAFIERSHVGLTHVNLHTAYKEPQAVFGGTRSSGIGLPEAGRSGLEFFSQHKVAYLRYG